MVTCMTVLAVGFLGAFLMPQSKTRELLVPVIGWAFAIFCGIYCVSPVDQLPEEVLGPIGYLDDIAVAVAGFAAAGAAIDAGED